MVTGRAPVLVTGAGGLLGSALVEGLQARGERVVSLGRADIDLANLDAIAGKIADVAPVRVFNCAAHTDLEAAESAPELDRRVNAVLPGVIADACARQGIGLVHFSSTGCYGDWKDKAYLETDPARPLSQHHQAKLAGEQAVAAAGGEHAIFRLGWLFGGAATQPKNFVWKRMVEAAGKSEMVSDAVQRGCPTHVDDVVRQVLVALDHGMTGMCNVVAQGAASRYDYVAAIIAAAGLPCKVSPGPGFARKAPVSPNETARNARLQAAGLDTMPDWRDSLATYVNALQRETSLG